MSNGRADLALKIREAFHRAFRAIDVVKYLGGSKEAANQILRREHKRGNLVRLQRGVYMVDHGKE